MLQKIAKTMVLTISLLTGLTACSSRDIGSTMASNSTSSVPVATPAPLIEKGVAVVTATSTQCANGGVVIESFGDLKKDGTLDLGDPIYSSTPICNGANGSNGSNGTNGTNGANGIGDGIIVSQATAAECTNGGFQFTTFRDANSNGQLDSGENIITVNTVCNGTNGVNGTNGTNGTNGNSFSFSSAAASSNQCQAGGMVYTVQEFDGAGIAVANSASSTVVCNGTNGTSMVFTTIAANSQQCATGGNVLLMASDTANTGVYAATDANQQSVVICDGATGATGATGAQGAVGPVSPFSTVAPIMPCGGASSPWKEVLLCMADGNILSDFSSNPNGQDTRLAFVNAGAYQDTDDSGCVFSVNSDSHGGLNVSWGAGHNAYSTWSAGNYDCAAH